MRLLTHNMLSCNIKGVTNGFPLGMEVEKVAEKEVEDYNPDFFRNMFFKIEWMPLEPWATLSCQRRQSHRC